MRLIDADALKESIECSDTDEKKILSPKELRRILVSWIDERPTVQAEKKYGQWDFVQYWRCSECGAQYQDVGYGWNFCPNCGVEMEDSDYRPDRG